jgi:DnaJ domain
MHEATDFYSILGVAQTATTAEIQDQFRFLSHAYHPDKFATEEQRNKAEEQFKKINESYSVLSDPIARARYYASRIELSDPWSNYQADIPESIVPDMPMWQQVLRWIAVLPGAIAGCLLAHAVTKLMSLFGGYDEDSLSVIGMTAFANGAAGYALVYCAAYIAPRAKITVAIIFAALSLSFVTLAEVSAIGHQEWLHLVYNIAFLVGSIIIAVSIAKGEEDV